MGISEILGEGGSREAVWVIINGERVFRSATKGGERVAKGKGMQKEKKKPKQKKT